MLVEPYEGFVDVSSHDFLKDLMTLCGKIKK